MPWERRENRASPTLRIEYGRHWAWSADDSRFAVLEELDSPDQPELVRVYDVATGEMLFVDNCKAFGPFTWDERVVAGMLHRHALAARSVTLFGLCIGGQGLEDCTAVFAFAKHLPSTERLWVAQVTLAQEITTFSVSPNDRWLLVQTSWWAESCNWQVLSATSGAEVKSGRCRSLRCAFAWSPDGETLALVESEEPRRGSPATATRLRVLAPTSDAEGYTFDLEPRGDWRPTFSADGKLLVACGDLEMRIDLGHRPSPSVSRYVSAPQWWLADEGWTAAARIAPNEELWRAELSPGGRYVAFVCAASDAQLEIARV